MIIKPNSQHWPQGPVFSIWSSMPQRGRGEESNIKIHFPESHESCLTSPSLLFLDCYKKISSFYPQSSYHIHSIIQSWLLIKINWGKAAPLVAPRASWVMKLSTKQGRNQSDSQPLQLNVTAAPHLICVLLLRRGEGVPPCVVWGIRPLWQETGFWLGLCCWQCQTWGPENSAHL